MRISSCFSVLLLATILEFSLPATADPAARGQDGLADYSGFVRFPTFGQKRRMNMDAVRSAIGHSLRVRKSPSSIRGNTFAHALRVRRGRQFDAMGHTLRIKRTVPGSHRSFGHALRVRRDGFDDDVDVADVQKFDDAGFDFDALNDNQENLPEYTEQEELAMAERERRASDGVRLHALRVKKGNTDDLWAKFFNQAQDQPAALRSTALMSPASWAKRKATLNHVLRVRKDENPVAGGAVSGSGLEEENTGVIYYY